MNDNKEIAVRSESGLVSLSLTEIKEMGKVFAVSGMFDDITSEAQAVVKIYAGKELGIPPITSMSKIFMTNGKVAIPAEIMADLIKRSGKYDYRVVKSTPKECEITFLEIRKGKWIEIGTSKFTMEEAGKIMFGKGTNQRKLISKANWQNYPEDMLFARTLSRGARRYCPDAIHGAYTTDEMNVTETTAASETSITNKVDAAKNNKSDKEALNAEIVDEPDNGAEKPEKPAGKKATPIPDNKKEGSPASIDKVKEVMKVKKLLPGETLEDRNEFFDYLRTALKLGKTNVEDMTTAECNSLIKVMQKNIDENKPAANQQADDVPEFEEAEEETHTPGTEVDAEVDEVECPSGYCLDCFKGGKGIKKKVLPASSAMAMKKYHVELCMKCYKARGKK